MEFSRLTALPPLPSCPPTPSPAHTDGIETKNIITGNLIANTRPSFAMLTTDATPASYWLVNGDNYVDPTAYYSLCTTDY